MLVVCVGKCFDISSYNEKEGSNVENHIFIVLVYAHV